MKTISADQFKKQYGDSAVSAFPQPQQEAPGYAQRVANQVKGNFNEAVQSETASGEGTMNPLAAGANIAKNASSIVLSPVTQALAPVFDKTITPISNAIVSSHPVQKVIDIMSQHPELAGALADTLETGLNAMGIEGTLKGASDSVVKVKSGLETAKNMVSNGVDAVKAKLPSSTPTDPVQSAIRDATPSYSKKLIGDRPIKGTDGTVTPRVQEGGVFKGRTVTPTKLETEAGNALTKIKDYPANGTALEKYHAIQPEIIAKAEALKTSLKNENVLRPPKEIANVVKRAIKQTANDSLLLQKTDPIIKNYTRVLSNAIEANDGTLAGELSVKQAMDAAYRNARGKAAFGSDTASALDEIHTAARDALTQDIIDNAQNTDVKAGLKEQWDLLRAADVLKKKAEAEATTAFGRFKQNNPVISKVTTAVGRAAGVGSAVDLLN